MIGSLNLCCQTIMISVSYMYETSVLKCLFTLYYELPALYYLFHTAETEIGRLIDFNILVKA